jgi:hypothetical protein
METKNKIMILGDDTFILEVKKWTPYTETLARQVFNVLGKVIFQSNKSGMQELKKNADAKQEPTMARQLKKINAERLERGEKGLFKEIMDKSLLLKRYRKMPVYKPILDHILENTKDTFTCGEMAKIIDGYYFNKLEKPLSFQSTQAYASVYGRYMADMGLVTRDLQKGLYKKTKDKKDTEHINGIVNEMIHLALRESWATSKHAVEISMMKEKLKKYNDDEIQRGLAKLIQLKKIYQIDKQKIRFM